MHASLQSSTALASEDLDLLQTFLEAWCLENSVDIGDDAARDVAIGLIDWYQFAVADRAHLKATITDVAPLPPSLQDLVERLAQT